MDSIKNQLRLVITRKCIAKGIVLQHINVGCEHAEILLMQGEYAKYAVEEGILIAQGCQDYAIKMTSLS